MVFCAERNRERCVEWCKSISGNAYHVTIPAVLLIAYLRRTMTKLTDRLYYKNNDMSESIKKMRESDVSILTTSLSYATY